MARASIGELELAASELRELIATDSSDWSSRVALGRILASQGDTERGLAELASAGRLPGLDSDARSEILSAAEEIRAANGSALD